MSFDVDNYFLQLIDDFHKHDVKWTLIAFCLKEKLKEICSIVDSTNIRLKQIEDLCCVEKVNDDSENKIEVIA